MVRNEIAQLRLTFGKSPGSGARRSGEAVAHRRFVRAGPWAREPAVGCTSPRRLILEVEQRSGPTLGHGQGDFDGAPGKNAPLPDNEGWQALIAGDLNGAEAAAQELLADDATNNEEDWPADDRQHMAHILLGYVCLRRGDIDGAALELIRSAQVEATPVLGSFGPDLSLAWQLLLAGKGDEVVQFAQLFSRSWDGPASRHPQ